MAEKRMFSRTIVSSDEFLDMPQSTQNLYFHLNLRADDDGFVNSPKSIMREVGGHDDDMKLLCAKRYLIPFRNGIVVIRHWKIHNYIAKDRYHETKNIEEKSSLILDSTNTYNEDTSIPICIQDVDKQQTFCIQDCIQNVDKASTQIRLGKNRIDKNRIDNIGASSTRAKKKTTALVKPEPDLLYQAIFQSFISKTGTFTNYPKEAQAIKRIIKYCQDRAPEDCAKFAKLIVTSYYNLTQNGNQFWRGQPFTPSALSSSGIFDRVMIEINQSGLSDTNHGEGNDIPF